MMQFINGQLDYLKNPVYDLEISKKEKEETEETEAAAAEEPDYDGRE